MVVFGHCVVVVAIVRSDSATAAILVSTNQIEFASIHVTLLSASKVNDFSNLSGNFIPPAAPSVSHFPH